MDTSTLSERGWEALGELRRLEDQGLTATRQPGGIHLATVKALQKLGLADIEDSPERDRKGRKWVATLTEAGRRAQPRRPGNRSGASAASGDLTAGSYCDYFSPSAAAL
ncbi:hypothetical protein [Streptomyces sp. ISL-86]|uniref:hypothetical protein n=1 Tax=Streptomyces sp. ISL-86 TaxID=2819187 RepID=UPI001BE4F5D2|nr:hypothetical protein [Streptomyces sp. ISL-86]MBT2457267.1 hypothetical protein [Streptomyces sp. ISL-86]